MAESIALPEAPARRLLAVPTSPDARHEIIDVVRGFALFGVLLANMVWTSQHFALTYTQRAALPTAGLDDLVSPLNNLLIQGKFYTLFSILFGLGFAVQLSRAAQRGQNVLPVYVRRLSILFVLGAVHAIFLWFGDILHLYALLGFLLILFRNRSDRALLGWALGIAALVSFLPFLDWALTSALGAGEAESAKRGAEEAAHFAAMTSTRWWDAVVMNWNFSYEDYTSLSLESDGILHWYLNVFWKFLLGFYIGRRLLLQEAERHLHRYRRLWPGALAIGLAGNALWTIGNELYRHRFPDSSSPLLALAWLPVEMSVLALSLAYLSALVLLYQRPSWRPRLALLAPVGRMALTNYLSQSVLLVALFYGVGLGLLGKVGETACIGLSLLIFAVQIVLSGWWLKRFRFGPAEWAWRCLTYGRLQPLRRAPAPAG